MASIHAAVVPSRISSPTHRSASKHPSSRSHPPVPSDPYHGHEFTAKIAAHFVAHLFTCPEFPPPVPGVNQMPVRLDHFIAYALHRTRLAECVTYAALYLLQRLKARFPAAKGSSGHRLFISAYMLASKIICDDTYSNKSWCIVAQHMFQLREINQMEREMCSYLEWQLNVEPTTLRHFQERVARDFAGPGPYPPLILPQESTPEPASTSSSSSPPVSSSIPSFTSRPPLPSSSVTPYPAPVMAQKLPSPPPEDDELTSPVTPDASHSTTTSPATSTSPSTPQDIVTNYHVEIVGESHYPRPSRPRLDKSARRHSPSEPAPPPVRSIAPQVDPYAAISERDDAIVAPRGQRKRSSAASPTTGRPKLQVGRDMFAYASRAVW